MWVINTTNNPKDSLSPVLLRSVIAIALVLVVTTGSQFVTASNLDEVPGGGGGNLSIPIGAGNATMMTNRTANENMTGVEFLGIHNAHPSSLSEDFFP